MFWLIFWLLVLTGVVLILVSAVAPLLHTDNWPWAIVGSLFGFIIIGVALAAANGYPFSAGVAFGALAYATTLVCLAEVGAFSAIAFAHDFSAARILTAIFGSVAAVLATTYVVVHIVAPYIIERMV